MLAAGVIFLFYSGKIELLSSLPEWIQLALMILSYFAAAWIISRILSVVVLQARRGHKRPYPKLLTDLLSAILYVIAFCASVALSMGQGAVGALASSGLIIAVLGFSIRHVVADTLAGVALGIEGPFRIGDWVRIDDRIIGKVIEIGWRTTRLLTPDSTYLILPNSQISKQRIINYSAPQRQFRTSISITLDHSVPVATARTVLLSAMKKSQLINQDPAPDVRIASYNENGIQYTMRYWLPGFIAKIDARDEILGHTDETLRNIGIAGYRRHITVMRTPNKTGGVPLD